VKWIRRSNTPPSFGRSSPPITTRSIPHSGTGAWPPARSERHGARDRARRTRRITQIARERERCGAAGEALGRPHRNRLPGTRRVQPGAAVRCLDGPDPPLRRIAPSSSDPAEWVPGQLKAHLDRGQVHHVPVARAGVACITFTGEPRRAVQIASVPCDGGPFGGAHIDGSESVRRRPKAPRARLVCSPSAAPDLPISRLGDLYPGHRWQPERGPGNMRWSAKQSRQPITLSR
jgi:hypothetical protein